MTYPSLSLPWDQHTSVLPMMQILEERLVFITGKSGEVLEQAAQRGYECSIPGGVQGQVR